MPDSLIDRLGGISAKMKDFFAKFGDMTVELNRLNTENHGLKINNARLEKEIRQLEEQVFILKSSIEPLDEKSKKDFEKRINEYLRTVRKCIAILQN